MKNDSKTCPLNLNNLPIKNILLFLLTLHTVWNMFKETSNKIPNLDDSISKLLGQNNIPNLMPLMTELTPLLKSTHQPQIPKSIPISKPLCGGSWLITKICLILIFIYLIYFIKTIVERVSVGMELNVNAGNPYMSRCPLGFGDEQCPIFRKNKCDKKKY